MPTIKELLNEKSTLIDRTTNIDEKTKNANWNKSVGILKEAQIPDILGELCRDILDDYPDAQIVTPDELLYLPKPNQEGFKKDGLFHKLADGSAELRMRWAFGKSGKPMLYFFNSISVSCDTATGDIIVKGFKKEVISKATWDANKGRGILNNAIVFAYRHPAIYRNIGLLDRPAVESK